ncbi:hypothetical protein L873DRAFT_1830053 [Choiromyces venosus 120613-1]|uniref:Uncharacterized protein n=1 Tax=Choiromyces venosus 120613-1 TaxID=1336337 RepID=A0A3N4JD72_9PEZI|nr:hypothetical protein L873DRAFT_1830053 [Choiromyces venosus 120613-1]
MMLNLNSVLLLLTLLTTTTTLADPIRAKRLLYPRQNSSFGGWGLRVVNCPAETQKCSGSGCCPKDMICVINSLMGGLACCPTSTFPPSPSLESCAEVIETLPVCPDPSWTLWRNGDQHPFCCLPGQFGYQTASGTFGPGSSCADPGMPVAASLLATSLLPAQGSGAPTATKSSARATGTPTRNTATTTPRAGSSATPTKNDPAAAGPQETSSSSSQTADTTTAKSGLSTGAIAGIGAGAGIIGLALIAGGIWWGFKRGQQKGREGQVVVENYVPAPEYSVGSGGAGGGGGGGAGAGGVGAVGAYEKPAGALKPAEVPAGGDGRRVEMQA